VTKQKKVDNINRLLEALYKDGFGGSVIRGNGCIGPGVFEGLSHFLTTYSLVSLKTTEETLGTKETWKVLKVVVEEEWDTPAEAFCSFINEYRQYVCTEG